MPHHQLLLKIWNRKLCKGRNSFPHQCTVYSVPHTVPYFYPTFNTYMLNEPTLQFTLPFQFKLTPTQSSG